MPDKTEQESTGQDAPQQEPENESSEREESSSSIEERLKKLEAELAERDRYIRELRDEAASRRIALKQQQEQHLSEQGKWKELAEQRAAEIEALSSYKEQAETLNGLVQQSIQQRVEMIPEDMRDIVPLDYPPARLHAWLDANLPKLTKPKAPNLDAGVSGGGRSQAQLTDEERDLIRRMGIDEQKYLTQKNQ